MAQTTFLSRRRVKKNNVSQDVWDKKFVAFKDPNVVNATILYYTNLGKNIKVEFYTDNQPMLFELCVCCGNWLERTTDNFSARNVKKGNLDKWFKGNLRVKNHPDVLMIESFQNSKTFPCNVCWAKMQVLRRTDDEIHMMSLKWHKCGGKDFTEFWMFMLMMHIPLYDNVTGTPAMFLECIASSPLQLGVNDTREYGKRCAQIEFKIHDKDFYELCLGSANITQNKAIKNLSDEYLNLMNLMHDRALMTAQEVEIHDEKVRFAFEKSWKSKPKELGIISKTLTQKEYYAELYEKHLHHFLQVLASTHVIEDKKKAKSGRIEFDVSDDKKITKDMLYALLVAQDFKCALTDMWFTIENGGTRPSFDRIDNNKPHTIDNIRAVIRLRQVPNSFTNLTQKSTFHWYIIQQRVELHPDVRAYYTTKHNMLNEQCFHCDRNHALVIHHKDLMYVWRFYCSQCKKMERVLYKTEDEVHKGAKFMRDKIPILCAMCAGT